MLPGKSSFITNLDCIYEQFKSEKVVGLFNFSQPYLVIQDVDLVKQVMVKDFEYFSDRRPIDLAKTTEVSVKSNGKAKSITNFEIM